MGGAGRCREGRTILFQTSPPKGVVSNILPTPPTLITDFLVALNRRKTTQNPFAANGGWAQKLGIPDVNGVNLPYFVGPSGGPFYRLSPGGTSSDAWEDVRAQEKLTKSWG